MYPKYDYNICPYENYYTHQAGSGMGIIYKGAPYQQGHGIGSFLGGLFRSVLPLLTSGAKAVGKEALNAGVGILSDMVSAKPMNDSVQSRFRDATTTLKRKADEKIERAMMGSGYKNKKHRVGNLSYSPIVKQRTVQKAKKKNINHKDIFGDL